MPTDSPLRHLLPAAGFGAPEVALIRAALADLPGFDTEALDKMAQRLVDFERWISERRHVVQGVVDTLQAEIARRYRDGEATVDGLLD